MTGSRSGSHRDPSVGRRSFALLWAIGITGVEALARRVVPGRSRAWLVAYSLTGMAAITALRREGALGEARGAGHSPDGRAGSREERKSTGSLALGFALVATGYPIGRRLLGDRPIGAPPDPFWLEALTLAGCVAPAEELSWGAIVEPSLGRAATSTLFAAKHVVIDGRWRRTLALALFWGGLALLRRRSRRLALAAHVAANATAVALGHLSGADRF